MASMERNVASSLPPCLSDVEPNPRLFFDAPHRCGSLNISMRRTRQIGLSLLLRRLRKPSSQAHDAPCRGLIASLHQCHSGASFTKQIHARPAGQLATKRPARGTSLRVANGSICSRSEGRRADNGGCNVTSARARSRCGESLTQAARSTCGTPRSRPRARSPRPGRGALRHGVKRLICSRGVEALCEARSQRAGHRLELQGTCRTSSRAAGSPAPPLVG
jgi:hypothetical protein